MEQLPVSVFDHHPIDPLRSVIDLVFQICSAARWLPSPSRYHWQHALLVRGAQLPGRLSFWLRLLNAAHLFDLTTSKPTAYCTVWFGLPLRRQILHLLRAWAALPKTQTLQRRRKRIAESLTAPYAIRPHYRLYQDEVRALKVLAILEPERSHLSPGWILLNQKGYTPEVPEIHPWALSMYSLDAFPQADYTLLWQLEEFLVPYAPHRYLLTSPALRMAAQKGNMTQLVEILERGTERPLPHELTARILEQPSARLLSGKVLEFDSSQELAQLRQRPALRQHLDTLLSPRHVHLPPHHATNTLQALRRAGIPILSTTEEAELPENGQPGSQSLLPSELADLYALALTASQVDLRMGVAPALLEKLAATLPAQLRRSAFNRAAKAIRDFQAQKKRLNRTEYPPPQPPGSVPPARIDALLEAARRGETIPVWYWAAGRQAAERRRLTPLLIENRGIYLLLVAYCHERKANRTFRLDRLLLEIEREDPNL